MQHYVLATPVRNDREQLPELLATLEAQTVRPSRWVVVDDSSDDGSLEWLEAAAANRSWMEVRRAPEAASEYLGAHVARIKRWGLEQALESQRVSGEEADAAGVLDADILLPSNHYEHLLACFAADGSLGVVSSVIQSRGKDGLFTEAYQREDLPRGGTQFFRRECLEAIGGLPPYPGFDGAANVKARLRGWGCQLVTDLAAEQVRETASRFGLAAGYARKGRYAWFLGHHPVLVLGRALAYSLKPPRNAGWHFIKAWLAEAVARSERCPDEELRSYYGKERLREYLRLRDGKAAGFVSSD